MYTFSLLICKNKRTLIVLIDPWSPSAKLGFENNKIKYKALELINILLPFSTGVRSVDSPYIGVLMGFEDV